MRDFKICFATIKWIVLVTSTMLSAPIAFADLTDIVYVKGTQTSQESMLLGGASIDYDEARRELCEEMEGLEPGDLTFWMSQLRDRNPALSDLVSTVGPAMGGIEHQIEELRESVCADRPDGSFNIIYTECSMTMWDGGYYLKITVPPGSSTPKMVMYPYMVNPGTPSTERPYTIADLNVIDKKVKGKKRHVSYIEPTGATGEHNGYVTQKYRFNYKGEINVVNFMRGETTGGPGAAMMGGLAGLGKISMTSKGTAWIASDVPGLDVMQAFYNSYSTQVRPQAGGANMMSGMIDQLAAIAAVGMPLWIKQTVKSKTAFMIGPKGTTTSTITNVLVTPGEAGARCEDSPIPADYEVINLSEVLAGTQQGNAGSASGASVQRPGVMSTLRSMFSRNGQQAGDVAAEVNSQNASSGQSSSDLTTSNLTQSVQMHLQALGYDPGNTEGALSDQSQVAIARYEYERKMEVTGQVSPQLLDALASEVDGR